MTVIEACFVETFLMPEKLWLKDEDKKHTAKILMEASPPIQP